jgi:hypothetical protein
MSYIIEITEDANDIPSEYVLNNESHSLTVDVNTDNKDVHLTFSTKESLRDFAKSLLHASYFGCGTIELYPLGTNDGWQVVDGVRLSEHSSRVFISYPE